MAKIIRPKVPIREYFEFWETWQNEDRVIGCCQIGENPELGRFIRQDAARKGVHTPEGMQEYVIVLQRCVEQLGKTFVKEGPVMSVDQTCLPSAFPHCLKIQRQLGEQIVRYLLTRNGSFALTCDASAPSKANRRGPWVFLWLSSCSVQMLIGARNQDLQKLGLEIKASLPEGALV